MIGGLALALGSAVALNWGFFRQHEVASALPRLSLRTPVRSLRVLFSNRGWLAGFVAGLGGWALYIGALKLAPLSLVQATSAGGIGVLALLVERAGVVRLTRREWSGVAVSIAGLVLLGISLAGHADSGRHGGALAVSVWVACSLAVGALAGVRRAASGLGVAAGVLYAGGDVATKAAVGGGAALAFVAAVLVCHGLAFVALQLGFQRGGALATAGVSTLLTNALPIAAGMALFGEGLPEGSLGAVRVLAFTTVVAGAVFLARPDHQIPGPAPAPA